MDTFRTLLEMKLLQVNNYLLTIGSLVSVAAIFLVTVLAIQLIKRILFRKRVLDRYERGSLYSLFQIIKYFLWILSILIMMQSLGIRLNVILASSAALLVGVGLGLQHTFNNFVSGIILLFEGSIKVGDVLELDGEVVEM
ncbi:MAG: mechanosensitive ion channel domain-containing protein, partial [Bacteroidales bacterium]